MNNNNNNNHKNVQHEQQLQKSSSPTWLKFFDFTTKSNKTMPTLENDPAPNEPQLTESSRKESNLSQNSNNTNNNDMPSSTRTSNESLDPLIHYNKYIVGGASALAFGSMLYTIRQQTKGKMKIPLQELLDNPAAAAANPKLAAYAFAGRAFAIATALVASGGLVLIMGAASILQVNTLKEFSNKASSLARDHLPMLQGNKHLFSTRLDEDDSIMDQDTYEFLREVQADLQEARVNPKPETTSQRVVSETLRESLGPFKPYKSS